MSEFLYLYRGGEASGAPEQMQQTMRRMTWLKELSAAGHVKDPGQPLDRTGRVVRGKTVTAPI
jgi:hypothetical protein